MRRRLVWLASMLLAGLIIGCQDPGQEPPPDPAPTAQLSAQLRISSDAHAFDVSELRAPAEQDLELIYINTAAIPHNVAIYSDASARMALYIGEIFTQGQVVHRIPALPAGLYFFRCDVHPDTMQGRLHVE